MSKLAVLFPGIGYNCFKPLLYYSRKAALEQDYEIFQVEYHDLPENVKGNPEKMKQAYEMAYDQTVKQLADVKWEAYTDVLFISKSIGTVVAAKYTTEFVKSAHNVYLTPVEWTFDYISNPDCLCVHGTRDPWAETGKIQKCCNAMNLGLVCIDEGNHSLETGDIKRDISIIEAVMGAVIEYIKGLIFEK